MNANNVQKYSVIPDDKLRKLKLINDLKISYDPAFISDIVEEVEAPSAAGATQDQTIATFDYKDLKKNISLFKQKVEKVCENEKLAYEEFDYFRNIFSQKKLTEFLFEFYVKTKFYGNFFPKIFHFILIDYENNKYFKTNPNEKIEYDHENILCTLLVIFKNKFHTNLRNIYEEFMFKDENNIKNTDERIFKRRKEFFKNKLTSEIQRIFGKEDANKAEIDNFFYNLAKKAFEHNLLNFIELLFDFCSIELDEDVKFYISKPLESKIKGYCKKKKIENFSDDENASFFSHFSHSKHHLHVIRKLDKDNLLSHDIVYNFTHHQWFFLGNLFYSLEYALYLSFVIFYSLSSLRVSKDYSFPSEFRWVSFSILIVLILIEIGELLILKMYYFYLFSKLLEIINFVLVLIAILTNEDNLSRKSSFYSVSILSTFLCLIFRSEKIILFGTYVYTLRKILFKSFKVLPIVFVMYLGVFLALKTRSRYLTEPDQQRDIREISFTEDFFSINMIKLSEMVLGNFDRNEFGLGTEGSNPQTFNNFLLLNVMIYTMPIFLFNLFIGIAVEEVSTLLQKGQLHLIKIRIDYIVKLFYFFNFLNLEKCLGGYFYPGYIWQIKRRKQRPLYNIRKYFLLMSNKLTNSRWGATYESEFGKP